MKNQKAILGLGTAISIIIGTVIGSGIFLTPSNVVAAAPSPFWSMSIWIVAGIISFLGCLIFSELAIKFPDSGGQYIYLFECFGPLTAYLYGWTLITVIQTGSIAAEASVFAQFSSGLFGANFLNLKILASLIIVGFTALNIFGLKKAAEALDFLTILKLLTLLFIPLSIFFFFKDSPPGANEFSNTHLDSIHLGNFGVGLIAAFWAYDGWNSLGYVAGDLKNPKRHIPLATLGGMVIVIFFYLAMNWAYQSVLTPSEIAASQNLASEVMTRAFGHSGGVAIAIAVIIATLGSTNAFIIAGSRIIQAMAEKGGLPKAFVNSTNAFLLQMLWSLLLLFSGRFDQLFTAVIMVSFLFYGLTAAGLIIIRKKQKSSDSEFKISLLIPAFYVLFCLFFTINSMVEKPKESLLGVGLSLLGIPAFYFFRPRQRPD